MINCWSCFCGTLIKGCFLNTCTWVYVWTKEMRFYYWLTYEGWHELCIDRGFSRLGITGIVLRYDENNKSASDVYYYWSINCSSYFSYYFSICNPIVSLTWVATPSITLKSLSLLSSSSVIWLGGTSSGYSFWFNSF